MTEAPIDQIEFRWDSRDDLTGIATSFDRTADFSRWNQLLRQYAGVSGRGNSAAAEAPSSAVYLTYPDGMAALILRCRDPHARPLYDADTRHAHGAGAGRLDLVARALIAPRTVLTAQNALRITVTEPKVLFEPPPGQAPRGVLPRLAWPMIRADVVSARSIEPMARKAQGLAPMIAAVLAGPERPVTVVLPPDDIRQAAHQSRALALLWASRVLLQPIFQGRDDGPAPFGWRPAFSTCEAPLSSSDGRAGLWLTFRDRGLDAPPVGEAPAVVHLDRSAAGQGVIDAAANRLAEAYRADGDECVSLVERVVRGHRTLSDRIEAIACSEEIAHVLSAQPAVNVRRPPALRPVAATVQAVGPVPAAPARQPSAPPPPDVQDPEPPARRPQPADPHLVGLYQRLGSAHDERDFRRLLTWIAARTARGGRLDRDGLVLVLKIMDGHRWFAEPVSTLNAAAERMADLIHPIFASGADDERLEERLARWHGGGRPPPLLADALSVLAARLEPDRADWLADHCLRHVPPPRGPAGTAFLLALVRLPRKWPAEVVGPLAWLSPVLLLIVGYLLLT
ncbi:hypothetical protein ACH35V_23325 [Actinomadura sp. 1N219]|uniref:hypothetical protein n=1 Tax=Actinomadura sp. 1N219 TaxID=3375152 RepID=UPI0037AAE8B5